MLLKVLYISIYLSISFNLMFILHYKVIQFFIIIFLLNCVKGFFHGTVTFSTVQCKKIQSMLVSHNLFCYKVISNNKINIYCFVWYIYTVTLCFFDGILSSKFARWFSYVCYYYYSLFKVAGYSAHEAAITFKRSNYSKKLQNEFTISVNMKPKKQRNSTAFEILCVEKKLKWI